MGASRIHNWLCVPSGARKARASPFTHITHMRMIRHAKDPVFTVPQGDGTDSAQRDHSRASPDRRHPYHPGRTTHITRHLTTPTPFVALSISSCTCIETRRHLRQTTDAGARYYVYVVGAALLRRRAGKCVHPAAQKRLRDAASGRGNFTTAAHNVLPAPKAASWHRHPAALPPAVRCLSYCPGGRALF